MLKLETQATFTLISEVGREAFDVIVATFGEQRQNNRSQLG